MRKYEIRKNPCRKDLKPITRQTQKENKLCTKIHKRVATRTEGLRIVREMRRQGIPCVVGKRA